MKSTCMTQTKTRSTLTPKVTKRRLRTPTLTPPRQKTRRESGWDIFPHQLAEYQERNPGTKTTPLPMNLTIGISTPGPVSQKTRHARRAYIGNLPDSCSDNEIRDFFTGALMAIGGVTMPGEPVLSIYINRDKKFAFVEFRSVEECSNCMAFEGILWRGSQLRVRRPNDYNLAEAASLGPTAPNSNLNLEAIGLSNGLISKNKGKDDAIDRIFIGGLPHFFTEEQVLDILRPFGEVKMFDIVKDKSTGQCKGYGFCIYRDSAVTDIACNALNGFKLGERSLTVKRALIGQNEQHKNVFNRSEDTKESFDFLDELQKEKKEKTSRFLIISDCLTDDDLKDENEYKDVVEDMRGMFEHYGLVLRLLIPRFGERGSGKVIIEFDNFIDETDIEKSLGRDQTL